MVFKSRILLEIDFLLVRIIIIFGYSRNRVSSKGTVIFRVSEDTARMRVNAKCDMGLWKREDKKKKEEDESKSETISGKSSGYLGRTRRIQERTMKSVNAVRSINGI